MWTFFKKNLGFCAFALISFQGCAQLVESDSETVRVVPRVVRQHSIYDYPLNFETAYDAPLIIERPENFLNLPA